MSGEKSIGSAALFAPRTGVKWPQHLVEQVEELYRNGHANHEIGQIVGLPTKSVKEYLNRHNFPSNYTKKALELVEGGGQCRICREIKDLTHFTQHRMRNAHLWRNHTCGSCKRKRVNASLAGNPRRLLAARLSALRKRSKKKDFSFDLTADYLMEVFEKQQGRCFYTGYEMGLNIGRQGDAGITGNSLSVDRVDSSRGYVMSNVVLCTQRANRIKSDLTQEELRQWIPGWYDIIAKHFGENKP